MTARLPFVPDWALEQARQPRVRATKFGDGYEQRLQDGINPLLDQWSARFTLKQADQEALDAFLQAQGGVTAFDLYLPDRAWAMSDSGFGGYQSGGDNSQFQLQYPKAATHDVDWRGAWPVYTKPRTNYCRKSEDVSDSVWGKVSGGTAVVPAVVANQGMAPDGTVSADLVVLDRGTGTTSADQSRIQQGTLTTGPFRLGTTWTFSVWLRTVDGSTRAVALQAWSTSSAPAVVSVTGSWTRFSFSATATADLTNAHYLLVLLQGDLATAACASLLVWGGQVEAGSTATRYIPNPTTAALAELPAYYPQAGDAFARASAWSTRPLVYRDGEWMGKVLLSEEPRTNFLQRSADLGTTWAASNATVSANDTGTKDPTGSTTTADKLTVNSSNAEHKASQTLSTTPRPLRAHCLSAWAKRGTAGGNYAWLALRASFTGGSDCYAFFNLSTGATGTVSAGSATGASASASAFPDGWYRLALSFTTPRTGLPLASVSLLVCSADGTLSFTGDDASFHWLWGMQLEDRATAGLYLATTSTAITSTDYALSAGGLVTLATALGAGGWVAADGSGDFVRRAVCRTWRATPAAFNNYTVDATFDEVMA